MKISYRSISSVIVLIVCMLVVDSAIGQTRYRDVVFPAAAETTGIVFGNNTPLGGGTDTLRLDLYEPSGDSLSSRPLVVLMHGGSLVSGGRSNMEGYCIDLARRGYVAATIDYRLGIATPKGQKTIQEALLRGVQDTKAAVRFFRANAATYGIDTSKIFLSGSSAGSMLSLHCAYWDQDEIHPDVDQATWGDIEGTSGNPGYSSDVIGVVSYSGALLEASWVDPGEAPSGNFHGLLDEVVPPDGGISTDFGIPLYGGPAVYKAATESGIYAHGAFFSDMGHGGNTDSLLGFTANFFYSVMTVDGAAGSDFSDIDLDPDSLRMFLYDELIFTTSAQDVNGNRIIVPQLLVVYSYDPAIGTMTSNGIFAPGGTPGSGYVYAKMNGETDSCFVSTYDFAYFVLSPDLAVTNATRPITLSIATYDADSAQQDLPITRFSLFSTNPSVGTVDSLGVFTPAMVGTTQIIASFGGYSDTTTIRVETANGTVVFDAMESLAGWTVQGVNLDSVSLTLETGQSSEGSASFRIDYAYTFTSGVSPYSLNLLNDLTVYGLPDSIYLDVRSDGQRHRLYYRFMDTNGEFFRGAGKKYLNDSTKFDNVHAPMTVLAPEAGNPLLAYPLTFRRLEIQLAGATTSGAVNTGTLYLDNLRLVYPPAPTSVEPIGVEPLAFELGQNYPNPFNPVTNIRFKMKDGGRVKVTVFDLLGREVTQLIDQAKPAGAHTVSWNASAFASGMYFYRIEVRGEAGEGWVQTKKMVLLR